MTTAQETAPVNRETLEGSSKSLRIANAIRDEINDILARYDAHPDYYESDVRIDAACVILADKALRIASDDR